MVRMAGSNVPGASVVQIRACDLNLGLGGLVSYFVLDDVIKPRALLSYVSESARNGVVVSQQRVFDHGAAGPRPRLARAQRQLEPARAGGKPRQRAVPCAMTASHLVTKMVAVDAYSRHSAWLSYRVLQASDPGLFLRDRALPDSAC